MTKTGTRTLAIAAACLLLPLAARAQELNLGALDETTNVVHVRTGAEHGFVAGVGYARVVPFFARALIVSADVSLPWASLDASDYRVRLGALAPVVDRGRWKLSGGVAPTLRGTETPLNRMTNVGVDLALVGGYYARRWFTAGEVGFDWALSTHVTHNETYRALVYPEARDGWYANAGGNGRAGAQGGLSFGRYDVVLRAGLVRDVAGEAPLLPFYGTLAVNARW
jgi:hypothetical protein